MRAMLAENSPTNLKVVDIESPRAMPTWGVVGIGHAAPTCVVVDIPTAQVRA